MSAGPFTDAKYENIAGNVVYPVRVQPETLELELNSVTNDEPTAAITTGVSRIALRRGRRAFGPAIRTVTVRLDADGAGEKAEYQENTLHTVPILAQATYASYNVGQTGTYQGIACTAVGIFPQK